MTDTNKNSQVEMPLYFDDFITRENYHSKDKGLPISMSLYPSTNLVETDTHFLIDIAVPGIAPEDILVDIIDNALEVHYDASSPTFFTGKRKIWADEFKPKSFRRRFELNPKHIDLETVDAIFDNGMLHIIIEKAYELKGKMIPVYSFSDN